MAQHDMNIANQGFPATRADLNNALQALVSNSSGTSAPSTTFANQWWYDTTNNKMYLRNEANNAWIEVFTLDQTNNEWQLTTGVVQAKDSDGLAIKTDDGTTRLLVKDDGNIGIGITPRAKLDIFGTGTGQEARVIIEGEGGADPYVNFLANNTSHWSIGIDDSDNDNFKLSQNSALGTNDYLVVNTSGQLGVNFVPETGWVTAGGAVIDLPSGCIFGYSTSQLNIGQNIYYDGLYRRKNAAKSSFIGLAGGNIDFSTGADGSADTAANMSAKMSVKNDGRVGINVDPYAMLDIGSNSSHAGNGQLFYLRDGENRIGYYYQHTLSSFTSYMELRYSARANTSAYSFAYFSSGNAADPEFHFRGDGNAFADGSWNAGGADYAEYFEWSDGNTDNEDRVGYTVVLDNEKIRKATSSDDAVNVIGAVSGNPSVIGDVDLDKWKHRYLTDDFGRYLRDTHNVVEWTETVIEQEAVAEVLDEDGNVVTPAKEAVMKEVSHSYEDWDLPDGVTVPSDATTLTHDEKGNRFTHRRPNPDYDPDREYVGRENRQEWSAIGMMGKLRIRKGQPTGDRWIKMRDISDTVEEWLVR